MADAEIEMLQKLAQNPHYKMSEEQQRKLHEARRAKNVVEKNVVNKANPNVDMHKPGMDTMQPERPQQNKK